MSTLASVAGTTGLVLASDADAAVNTAAKKAKVTFAPSGDGANLTIEAVTTGTAGMIPQRQIATPIPSTTPVSHPTQMATLSVIG